MSSRLFKKFVTTALISSLGGGSVWAAPYLIQSGDTLSRIAQSHISGKVWGRSGSLHKLLALNPALSSNPNHILTGQKIEIPGIENSLTEQSEPRSIEEPSDQKPNFTQRLPAQTTEGPTNPAPAPSESPICETKSSTPLESATAEPSQQVTVGLGYKFTTLNAQDVSTGASAKLFTGSDIDFNAAWVQTWNSVFSTFFEFGIEKLNFQPSNNAAKTLTNVSQTPANFSLGGDFKVSPRLRLLARGSYGQKFFLISPNTSTISVDSVYIPSFSTDLVFTFLERRRTSLGLDAMGSYLLSANADGYSVSNGTVVGGAFFLNQKFGSQNEKALQLSVGYQNRLQNTSLVNQNQSDAFARITFSISVFGESEKGKK